MDDASPDRESIESYYADDIDEDARLFDGIGQLERVRTEQLLARYLPQPPATVRDIGGGPGYYAAWLARREYDVHLLDLVEDHVAAARERSKHQPENPIAGFHCGDARELPWDDASSDGAVILGPLYHLQRRSDRLDVLREARRVVRPGGVVLAAGISRYASMLDGLHRATLGDEKLCEMVEQDLRSGRHDNPTENPAFFTESYFHRPDELRNEAFEVGLHVEAVVGLEGPGWILEAFGERWEDEFWRDLIVSYAEMTESEYDIRGLSPHLMLVADVPSRDSS